MDVPSGSLDPVGCTLDTTGLDKVKTMKAGTVTASLGTAIALLCTVSIQGCHSPMPVPSIPPNAEVSHLKARLRGTLIVDEPVGGIASIALRTGTKRVVRQSANTQHAIRSLAGPDAEGQIAYLSQHPGGSGVALRMVSLDGTGDRLIAPQLTPGSSIESIVLAPSGRRVARLADCHSVQMQAPAVFLEEGTVEIWNGQNGQRSVTGVAAIAQGLAWFPDGRHLAVVRLLPRSVADPLEGAADGFGSDFLSWPRVPVVCSLDVVTRQTEVLHVGWSPVVAEDGKHVIVEDLKGRLRRVDVRTGESKSTSLPGKSGEVLWLQRDGMAVYWGWPTEGQPTQQAPMFSPAGGRRDLLPLRAAKLDAQQSQKILSGVDPRRLTSVGPGTLPASTQRAPGRAKQ